MPCTTVFPKALGTGLLISTARPVSAELRAEMERLIDGYEHVLSRFRADSLVTRIGDAEHGGHFDFPDWTGPLFDLYDTLHDVTRGAIDPCVGEDLIRLGYDPTLSFTVEAGAGERLGALRGRPVWGHDVVRSDVTTLVTHGPVHLDFGACGKGYLVDLLGGLLGSFPEFVIDAGGDLLAHTSNPIRVALEDPDDSSRAVGVAEIRDGAFCASAPSRRHWEVAVDERTHLAIHHLLNAVDGLPAQQMEPRGLPCDPRRSPTIRLRWRTGWLRRCSLRTRMNCAAFLFSIAPRWTPTVTPPSAPVSPAVSSDCRPVTDCQVAGWRPANRRPQTGQSQAKLTE